MQVQVSTITTKSIGVKSFELRSIDKQPLPQFEPGAHVRITIPGLISGEASRAYSLVSDPQDRSRYEVAVLHVESGSGGSARLHQEVKAGDILEVSAPRNDFRIENSDAHSVLFAGGIGITPIFSLARELALKGASMEVHFVGRGKDHMPYADELMALAPSRTHLYFSRTQLDLHRVIGRDRTEAQFYVCGPHALIEGVREALRLAGIPASRLHFESFGYRQQVQDQDVEVELRGSQRSLLARPGRPLLEAVEEAGGWIPADCRKGECGTCITTILGGRADHRDHCLTPDQRETLMCPCVSWAATEKLILDL